MKLFVFIFTLVTVNFYSQEVEIFADVNAGTLTNGSLKKFHNQLADQLALEGLKTTDNFELNQGFTVGFTIHSINTSFFFSQKVAGSKSSISDFSGSVRLTNEVRGNTIGGFYERSLIKRNKGGLFIGFKGAITFSKLILINDSSLINNNEDTNFDFNAIDLGIGTLLTYKIKLLKAVTLKPFVGFDFYFSGKLKFKEVDGAHLTFDDGDEVRTDWTGLNFGIGISTPLF